MNANTPALSLHQPHERFQPQTDRDTFVSAKANINRAAECVSTIQASLDSGEIVRFIAPTGSIKPNLDFIAVTDRTFLGIAPFGRLEITLPLAEVTFGSKRNANSWSRQPDTLTLQHGASRYNIARVPPPDHGIFGEFAERARLIHEVDNDAIFTKLAMARDAKHASTPPQATARFPASTNTAETVANTEIDAAIARLKQLDELRQAGILSQEEFSTAKSRLGLFDS